MNARTGVLMSLLSVLSIGASAETVDVTVRHAPYVVSTVSSKSVKAWAKCIYCGAKSSYERTFTWNVYDKKWEESTDPSAVPNVCRSCKSKEKDQEKLDQRERELDRRIEALETRKRIDQKEKQLKRLRKETR